MKILLTGVSGQLGREMRSLLRHRHDVIPTARTPVSDRVAGAHALDLSRPDTIANELDRHDPDLVVNCAAYTAVDRAEDEPGLAMTVNAEAPARMADWAARRGRGLVHFSTDYVFDGRKGRPYVETDETAPLNVYGRSKRAGELAVLRSGARHLVLRSSWIYASHGHNFLRTMLRLAREGRSLRIVDDQVGNPTWAAQLARYAVTAMEAGVPEPKMGNLYHCADRDAMSWFAFAMEIFGQAVRLGLLNDEPRCEPVESSEYPQPATRPSESVLDCSAFERQFGVTRSSAAESITGCLKELKQHG